MRLAWLQSLRSRLKKRPDHEETTEQTRILDLPEEKRERALPTKQGEPEDANKKRVRQTVNRMLTPLGRLNIHVRAALAIVMAGLSVYFLLAMPNRTAFPGWGFMSDLTFHVGALRFDTLFYVVLGLGLTTLTLSGLVITFVNDAKMAQQELPSGVILQLYLPSMEGGLRGVKRHARILIETGAQFILTCPTEVYCKECPDGPYSPLVDPEQPFKIDPEFGGERVVRRLSKKLSHANRLRWLSKMFSRAIRSANLALGADLVVGHIDHHSALWQRALQGDKVAQSYFRLFDDPIASGFADETGKPKKVNIFGLLPYKLIKKIKKHISLTFTEEQIELDATSPAAREFHANRMRFHYKLGARLFRLDAIAYSGGPEIETEDGTTEPTGLDLAAFLRLIADDLPEDVIILVEVGGNRIDIAPWLRHHRGQRAYDFGKLPKDEDSILTGDWTPSRTYVEASPQTDEGTYWVHMSHGGHDEGQNRYEEPKRRNRLNAAWGGPNGEYVIFEGMGINQLIHNLIPNEAHNTLGLVNYTLPGEVVVYLPELMHIPGDIHAEERWPRRPKISWALIEAQLRNPLSPLSWHVRCFKLRASKEELQPYARYVGCDTNNPAAWAYARTLGDGEEGREGDILVLSSPSSSVMDLEVDWSRWAGMSLWRFETDGQAYLDGDQEPKWVYVGQITSDTAQHYQYRLRPYETVLFEVK